MPTSLKSPGTLASDSALSGVVWSNPGNASSSDNSRASASMGSGNNNSQYLKATNFGFSIPTGATIDGIEVLLERQSTLGRASDHTIKLVKGGTVQGNDNGGQSWPSSEATYTYGSSSDLWGLSLSDSDINASNFGVVVAAQKSQSCAAEVDHIQIRVHYTESGGTTYDESITLSAVASDTEAPTATGEGSASLAVDADMANAPEATAEAESTFPVNADISAVDSVPTGAYEEEITLSASAGDSVNSSLVADSGIDLSASASDGDLSTLNAAEAVDLDSDVAMAAAGDVVGVTVTSEKRNPGSLGTSGTGDTTWQDAENAQYSDNRRAWCEIFQPNMESNKLTGSNYGFSIPTGATIEGVEVTVEHRAQPADDIEIAVRLLVDFIENGDSKDSFTKWPYNDTAATFGGETDTWGLSLNSQTVNNNGFGFSLYIIGASGPSIPAIDNVYITVFYTTSGTATAEEALDFDVTAGIEMVSDLGGSTYEESLEFAVGAGMGLENIQNVQSAIEFDVVAIVDSGNDKEDIAVKLILDDATVESIQTKFVLNVIEDANTDHQVLVYQDESCRVYETGGESKTIELVLKPETTLRDLLAALRTETGNIRLYYNYKYQPTVYSVVRVHPLIPLDYAVGGMDADKLLRAIFYEQIT